MQDLGMNPKRPRRARETAHACILVTLSLLICVVQPACSSYRHCRGRKTSCANLNLIVTACTDHVGCHLVSGCTESIDYCIEEKNPYSCSQLSTTLGYTCAWAKDRCGTPCDFIGDNAECLQARGCIWAQCTGVVKQCSDYSEDDCPGGDCYVEEDGI
jgi:hypothetical protein